MGLHWSELPAEILDAIHRGVVIPAHPLALNARRELDPQRQRALTRYYIDAGAGGVAVGVHTTQFAIRKAGLYEPVLTLGAEACQWTDRPLVRVAGLVGDTRDAKQEAAIARALGYHAGLLSLGALRGASMEDILAHCRAVAQELPLFGFYLQPAVGGLPLPRGFWRRFAAIDNVVAIKVAPFNRYATLDVVTGVAEAGAEDRVTLYTGNDDHILLDLVTPFQVVRDGEPVTVRIKGGLLGHWSVWTHAAVGLFKACRKAAAASAVPVDLLALDSQVTDCNSAIFDVANGFRGCIAGCHEVLRRQGLLEGTWCLDRDECLSPGQAEEITRVQRSYPHLTDDDFVKMNLERWLS